MRSLRALLLIGVGAACAATALNSAAQSPSDWRPTNLEVYQLPRFCWSQFQVPNVEGPEFHIKDCGPAANHYCFALTYLLRAKRWTGKGKPTGYLMRADTDVAYTEGSIKDYPNCNIRGHVADTRAELNNLMRMYGIKPPQRPK